MRLTADDGTETELGNVENAEPVAGGLVRAMTGLENDLSSVRSLIKSKTPSDVQTIVIDHGDTAQLQQQDQDGQVSAPESPGNDLAGIGGTLGEERMEADDKLELSDAEGEDADDLWSLLDDNLITPPPHDGKKFLPLNELRRIIAKPKVRRALRSIFPDEKAAEYANAVCNRTIYNDNQRTTRQRMFAILVLTENIGALPSLIDEDLHDAHLPFQEVRDEGGKKWYLCCKGKDGTRIRFEGSRKWTNPKIKSFVDKQWHFLSPFFDMLANKPLAYLLEPMIILPFLDGDEGHHNTVYGGYSTVWRVKIHHAHHNYTHVGLGQRCSHVDEGADMSFIVACGTLLCDQETAFRRQACLQPGASGPENVQPSRPQTPDQVAGDVRVSRLPVFPLSMGGRQPPRVLAEI